MENFGEYTKKINKLIEIGNLYTDKKSNCLSEELEYGVMKNHKYWDKINSDLIEKYEDRKRKINYQFALKEKDVIIRNEKGQLQYTEEGQNAWHAAIDELNKEINAEKIEPKIYKMIKSEISKLKRLHIEELEELGFVE